MTTKQVAVIGGGATGAHCVHALLAGRPASARPSILVHDPETDRESALVSAGGGRVERCDAKGGSAEVVVLATPVGSHAATAASIVARGASVVSLSDALGDVRDLFELEHRALDAGTALVVGAGFAPGLTCLLTRHAANALDEVAEIAVAKAGTGGPACARQHHRAMKQGAWDWFDGSWVERAGGSGRDLVWFPPPIGARDSYKAALASPLLLQRSFPDASRIVARLTATRRDRLTSRLPMLRAPHPDGGPGAVRVEVRGRIEGRFETVVYAVSADPSKGAGVTGACVAEALVEDALPVGAFGLSELADPKPLLRAVSSAGLTIATFDGTST